MGGEVGRNGDGREGRLRSLATAILIAVLSADAGAAELPIFDTHIHYGHDTWDALSPKDAVAILRKAGVKRALVSSANDDGTLMLLQEAPDLVVPELTPYRKLGEFGSWYMDETVPGYLEERLKKTKYFALGEFHIYGAQAERPVVKRVIELARQHKLYLHADADPDAIDRIFRHDPGARVIWAHAGFKPLNGVLGMLHKHRNLWCDLSVRGDMASDGKVRPDWRAAFEEFPDRFMVGTDSSDAQRWHHVEGHAIWARGWLKDLPQELAERIAYKNAEALISMPGEAAAR